MTSKVFAQLEAMRRPLVLGRDYDRKVNTVRGLVEMRKAGRLKAIYCDEGVLRLVWPLPHDGNPAWMRWEAAEALVEAFYAEGAAAEIAKKPVQAEVAGKKRVKKEGGRR